MELLYDSRDPRNEENSACMMEASDQTLCCFLFVPHPRAPTELCPCSLSGHPGTPHRCWAGAALVARTRHGSSSLTEPERRARALGRSPAAPRCLGAAAGHARVLRSASRCSTRRPSSTAELRRAQVLAERTVQRWVRELEMGGEAGA